MKTQQVHSIALESGWDIPQSLIVLAAAVAVPFLIHLIPFSGGVPLGMKILPLFYIPLIAILVFRFHVGFIAALLAPIVNYLITGQPVFEMVMLLSAELALFAGAVYLCAKHKYLRWIAGPLSFIIAKGISSLSMGWMPFEMTSGEYWINAVSNGTLGIMLLLILNIVVLRFWKSLS